MSLDPELYINQSKNFLTNFLPNTQRPGCAILGDFGSGKTSLSYSYAAKLAREWVRKPASGFLPIAIKLRYLNDFSNFKSQILSEINDRLATDISTKAFDNILENTRFLFVLDGLDEIATRWDQELLVLNLAQLERFTKQAKNSKFLITCRTHFFRTRIDEEILGGLMRLYLRSWGADELVDYVEKSNPASAETTLNTIKETYNLEELSKTPIFLKMITETIADVRGQVDHAQLYKFYTDKWINEQIDRSSIEPHDKRALMETIAFQMMSSEKLKISHDIELPNLIAKHFGVRDFSLNKKLDQDVRTCSFLVRDERGDYYFVHKSYMEYFVGCVIAKDIQAGSVDRLSLRDFGFEVGSFVACFFKSDWKLISQLLIRSDSLFVKLNALSIASNLEPHPKFERIMIATLFSEENEKIRRQILECLSHWGTEISISSVVDVAMDPQDKLQRAAVTLLAPYMDREAVGDRLAELLDGSHSMPVCAAVIECAVELRTDVLASSIDALKDGSFWRTHKDVVFASLKYIAAFPHSRLMDECGSIMKDAAKLSESEAKEYATTIFNRARGIILREIENLRRSNISHRRIEGIIRSKFGMVLDDQDVGSLIRGAIRVGDRSRSER